MLIIPLTLIGIFFTVSNLFKKNIKFNKIFLWISITAGSICGLILFFLKRLYPKLLNLQLIKINRMLMVGIFIFILLSLIMSLIFFYKKANKMNNKMMRLVILSNGITSFLLISYTMNLMLGKTQEFIAFGETSIGTMALFRLIGYTLGILIALLYSISVNEIFNRINLKIYKLNYCIFLFICTCFYFFNGIISLQRLNIIKNSKFVFKLMIFGDNYNKYIIFLLIIFTIVISVYLFLNSKNINKEFPNNALYRKEKAKLIKNKRWSVSLMFFGFISLFTLSFLSHISTKEVALTPPQSYVDAGEQIIIPLNTVDDGHLHRFSYEAKDNTKVRFIVVKKGLGNAYGIGLDACEICGEAGYYEKKDNVICKKCDVIMNKATIGFKGGCNPVPFPYAIKESKIYIQKNTLEKESYRFK